MTVHSTPGGECTVAAFFCHLITRILRVGPSRTEGHRRFDQLSLPRMAGWGGVGGLLFAALFATVASLGWGGVLVLAPSFAFASAAGASGSLALARRAGRRALPDTGDSAA